MNKPVIIGGSIAVWLGLWAWEVFGTPSPTSEALLWLVIWLSTFGVSVVNLLDARAILRAGRADHSFDPHHFIVAKGHVRRETLRCVASMALVLVGLGAIFHWDVVTVPFIFGGALALLDNSLLDRIDRRRLLQ